MCNERENDPWKVDLSRIPPFHDAGECRICGIITKTTLMGIPVCEDCVRQIAHFDGKGVFVGFKEGGTILKYVAYWSRMRESALVSQCLSLQDRIYELEARLNEPVVKKPVVLNPGAVEADWTLDEIMKREG